MESGDAERDQVFLENNRAELAGTEKEISKFLENDLLSSEAAADKYRLLENIFTGDVNLLSDVPRRKEMGERIPSSATLTFYQERVVTYRTLLDKIATKCNLLIGGLDVANVFNKIVAFNPGRCQPRTGESFRRGERVILVMSEIGQKTKEGYQLLVPASAGQLASGH